MKKLLMLLFVGVIGFTATAQDKTAKIEFATTNSGYNKELIPK